jgi:Tol biopolymer transport system component
MVHFAMRKFCLVWLAVFVVISGCTVKVPSLTNAPAGGGPAIPTQTFETPAELTSLHLTGRLVYLSGAQPGNNASISIQSLDLATGALTTLFQAPSPAYIYAASVSPDEKQVVLSYTPSGDFPALYLLPLDGSSSPRLLFSPPGKYDEYLEPVWSPDGRWIYFVHSNFDPAAQKPNRPFPFNEIQRLAYPSGAPEAVVANAYWPRLSADGTRLVYVSQNPKNSQDFLSIAGPDGGHPSRIELSGPDVPTIIDAPLLLPDGKTLLFSAPTSQHSAAANWLDRILEVQAVSAHSVPSEWWSVAIAGGKIAQLTHIQSTSLYTSISPDGTWLASFSGNGVFLMHPDGTGLTMVVSDVGGIAGTVDWIP